MGAFARAAIRGQPLDYLSDVWKDMLRYVIGHSRTSSGGLSWEGFATELLVGAETNPERIPAGFTHVRQPTDFRPYYPNPGLLQKWGPLTVYRDWERATRIEGLVFLAAFGLMLVGPFLARPAASAGRRSFSRS